MTRIEIVIDELVLSGFARCDRLAVADAVQQHLAERIRAGAVKGGLEPLIRSEMRAADVAVPPGRDAGFADRLGAGIAGSLVNALSTGGR